MAGFGRRRVRDGATGPTTLIAEGCTIEGRLSGDNDLLLSGTVIGDSTLNSIVTITPGGRWQGVLRAAHVIVSGSVDGDVIASGKIEIAATARIKGTVTGDMIAVAEGAVIEGDMKITGTQTQSQRFSEKREAEVTAIGAKKAS
ncbi:MAG: polymer-forming cytoskeletal protein [Pseudomonadota bacterium]